MRRLVLGIAIAAAAWAPSVGFADDTRIAEFIKNRLQTEQQAGNLRGFNIDMRVEQGTIWFKGHVADEAMESLVLKAGQAAGHLGAVQVVDEIEVKAMAPAMPAVVQASESAMPLAPMAQPSMMVNYQEPITAAPPQGNIPLGTPTQGPLAGQPVQAPVYQGTPVYQGGPAYQGGPVYQGASAPMMQASAPMPLPMGSNGGQDMAAMAGGQPNMPGYAWPGYAAYPNYGAVTYPTQYSPSAWPYIGPFYPYPQVPLGWRRVELEWDDGWWYLDFHDR